jgi:hypothetical protein
MGFAMVVHGTTLVSAVADRLRTLLADLQADRLDPSSGFATLDEFKEMVGFSRWNDIGRT